MGIDISVYWEFLKKAFQTRYVYRSAVLISFSGAMFQMIIQICIWSTLFRSGSGFATNVTFQDMINFIIINQIIMSLTQSKIGSVMSEKIREGTIALDFVRPVTMKYGIIAGQLGENLFNLTFNTIPLCICAIVFLGFKLPEDPYYLILFFISFIYGIIIIYTIHYILGLLAFWLESPWYIPFFVRACLLLFGGTFTPIWFYPAFLARLCRFLPFSYISFEPINIYLEKISKKEGIAVLLIQFAWIVVLTFIEKAIWSSAQKKIVIQGG
jgi:ABC-2 type transport system permease protein